MPTVDDVLAIQSLISGYALAVDVRDADALQALLSEDVQFSWQGAESISGREQVIAHASKQWSSIGPTAHVAALPRIEVFDDHTAASANYTHAEHLTGHGTIVRTLIAYSNRYRREASGWRITNRDAEILYSIEIGRPAPSHRGWVASWTASLDRSPLREGSARVFGRHQATKEDAD
jgi:ketosteroid isomerase-like protein